jgi:hypothetical protein
VTSTITTTVWVIDCVHHNTTHAWAFAKVAVATGFADFNVLVLFIADNADTCSTDKEEFADFTARHTHLGVIAFFGHEHGTVACTTHGLSAATGLELECMYGGADWDVCKWEAVAHFYSGIFMRAKLLALLHATCGEDVVIHTLVITHAGNPGAPVRVVFYVLNRAFTLEVKVHKTVVFARSTALMASSYATLVVAAIATALCNNQ